MGSPASPYPRGRAHSVHAKPSPWLSYQPLDNVDASRHELGQLAMSLAFDGTVQDHRPTMAVHAVTR
jgi:hypothetical protein